MQTTTTTPPPTRRLPGRSSTALLLGTAVATLMLLLPAAPAAAHDELVEATPAAGTTVTAPPATVDLTFSADLLELGGGRNGVVVTDADGLHYETACASVAGDALTAPVALGAAGTYSVQWRAVSGDGHGVGDTYDFTYDPADGAPAAAGSADGPPCGAASTAPVVAAAAGPGGAIAAGAIGAAVLLAAVAAVLVVVVRLRRAGEGDAQ